MNVPLLVALILGFGSGLMVAAVVVSWPRAATVFRRPIPAASVLWALTVGAGVIAAWGYLAWDQGMRYGHQECADLRPAIRAWERTIHQYLEVLRAALPVAHLP